MIDGREFDAGQLSERLRNRREKEEKRIEAERQRYEALITSEPGKQR